MNWSVYSLGRHTIKLYINGNIASEHDFDIAGFGQEFAKGISGSFTLTDFPETGESTVVEWSEALQNFGIVERN